MKFVKKLLGLSPAAPTPTPVKKTIHQLSASEVVEIALNSADTHYSADELKKAITKLSYGSDLIQLANAESKMQGLALTKLSEAIDNGQLTLNQLKQDLPQFSQQLIVASGCKDQSLSDELLASYQDESELLTLIEQSPSAHMRLKLVEKIHAEQHLRTLEKRFKNKDKTCFKLVRTRLDQIKAEKAEQQAREQKLQTLVDELTAHAQRGFNKDYAFKLDTLTRRQAALSEAADSTWQSSTQALIEQCQAVIAETEAEAARHAEHAAEQKKAAQQALSSPAPVSDAVETDTQAHNPVFDDILKRYCELGHTLLSECFTEAFTIQTSLSTLQALNEEWDQHADTTAPSRTQSEDKTVLTDALAAAVFALTNDEALRTALQHIGDDTLSEDAIKDENRSLTRFKQGITRLNIYKKNVGDSALCLQIKAREDILKKSAQAEKDKHRHISALIRKAGFATNDGHLKRAHGIKNAISELIDDCQHLPRHIQKQWEELQKKVDDLGDWHAYAATPKLESLVDAMKKLADAPLAAELQATQIHKLQDEWKSISKGGGDKYQDLWEAFKAAADIAFEPCKKHYQNLDAERAANSDKRAELIKQLEGYIASYNWEAANWSQVENLLRSAKKEWQSYNPVLRDSQKAQQQEFNKQIDAIQDKLHAEYNSNKAEKERLIQGLAPLVNSDDTGQAIDVAIKFQKQWKLIGRCRHRDEDALWKQFRSHCDAIFAKRDAERQAEQGKINDKVASAEKVIQSLQALLDLDAGEFEKQYRSVDEISAEFYAIEDLPKNKQSALQNTLRKISSSIDERFTRLQKEKGAAGWQALFDTKQAINTALNENNPEAIAELSTRIAALSFTPGQSQKLLTQAAATETSAEQEDNEQKYRLICIKAEVLSDSPTPEADKAARMQYQVTQLQSGLGNQTNANTPLQLAEEWLTIGPVDDSTYASLSERFLKCWKQL